MEGRIFSDLFRGVSKNAFKGAFVSWKGNNSLRKINEKTKINNQDIPLHVQRKKKKSKAK